MKLGYARISTKNQSLKDQITWLKSQGVDQKHIYAEQFTGTAENRPKLDELRDFARDGDVIYVTKLDRLGRSAKVINDLIDEFIQKGVSIVIGNMTFDNKTSSGRLLVHIMADFAEFEHDLVVERLAEGRKFSKNRSGRKVKFTTQQQKEVVNFYKTHSMAETAKTYGVSKATIGRYARKLGYNKLK